jgi:hypothetical protein
VTRAEARAIVGDPVAVPRVAPLGPTCIYATPDERFITLAVQPVDVAAATRGARGVIKAQVGGRKGVCVTSGSQQRLLVPLSSGRALAVTAPCPIGTGFAAKALSRLSG